MLAVTGLDVLTSLAHDWSVTKVSGRWKGVIGDDGYNMVVKFLLANPRLSPLVPVLHLDNEERLRSQARSSGVSGDKGWGSVRFD